MGRGQVSLLGGLCVRDPAGQGVQAEHGDTEKDQVCADSIKFCLFHFARCNTNLLFFMLSMSLKDFSSQICCCFTNVLVG